MSEGRGRSVSEQIGEDVFFAGGGVEGAEDLDLDVGGEAASFAGAGDHLAGDVLGGGFYQLFGLEGVFGHELHEGLFAEVEFEGGCHGEDHTILGEKGNRL